MKALGKIASIVIMLACVASLYFVFKISGQKTQLRADVKDMTDQRDASKTQLASAKKDLEVSNKLARDTQNDLVQTKAALDGAKVEIDTKTHEIDASKTKLADAETAATDAKTKQAAAEQQFKDLQTKMAAIGDIDKINEKLTELTEVNKKLTENLGKATDEKTQLAKDLEDERHTPPDVHGKIALAKTLWNFVVLDIGRDNHVRPNAEFLVYRDSKVIAKTRITSVNPDSSVGEIISGFGNGAPRSGDEVISQKAM